MEQVARVQTVIRLAPHIMERAKQCARKKNMSFNAYVEAALEEVSSAKIPKLSKDFQIAPEIAAFNGMIPAPTQEELDADPRLANIMCI